MNTRVGWCGSTGENLAARSLDAPYCSSKHCTYGSTHVNDCKNFEVTFFFAKKVLYMSLFPLNGNWKRSDDQTDPEVFAWSCAYWKLSPHPWSRSSSMTAAASASASNLPPPSTARRRTSAFLAKVDEVRQTPTTPLAMHQDRETTDGYGHSSFQSPCTAMTLCFRWDWRRERSAHRAGTKCHAPRRDCRSGLPHQVQPCCADILEGV